MDDVTGWAALVTATLGGAATLIVSIATLIATVRGNRQIENNSKVLNGRLDQLMSEAATRAYLQGVREGERLKKGSGGQGNELKGKE
jgi:hypothetical protein